MTFKNKNMKKKVKKKKETDDTIITDEEKEMLGDILAMELLNLGSRYSCEKVKRLHWKLDNMGIADR